MNEYTTFAPIYDLILNPFLRGMHRRVFAIVKDLEPFQTIDVCCGTGAQLRFLKRNNVEALGIDISRAMLKIAGRGQDAPDCFLQDAAAIAFKDHCFDLSIASFALHETEWENARRILNEIHRILKPSGALVIVDYELGEQSGFLARIAIRIIEYMAGKRHHTNFLRFNRKGGLKKLIDPERFTPVRDSFHKSRCVVIKHYKKIA